MLMIIITVYVFICALINFFVTDRVSKYLIFIYSSYWCLSLFICFINPYQFYPVSYETYILLLLHIILFVVGFLLVNNVSDKKISRSNLNILNILYNKFFIVLFLVCLLFVLFVFVKQQSLLAFYSLTDVRGDFVELALGKNGVAFLMYTIVASAMYHFSLCCVMYLLFFDRKWGLIIPLFLYVLLFSLLGGGRAQIMNIAYYMLGMWILSDRIVSLQQRKVANFKMPYSLKIMAPLILFFGIVVMSFMTAMRSGNYNDFSVEAFWDGLNILGLTFVEYSIGPIVAFDEAISSDIYLNQSGGYWYGRATFAGFDYLFYMFGRIVGLYFDSAYDNTTSLLQHESVMVAPDRGWNYAYTSCMYYYYDFGYIGVLMFPFVLGIIVRKLIRKFYMFCNIYSIAMMIFVTFCLYMSVFSGYLHKNLTIPYMIMLLILFNLNKNKTKYNA